MLGSLVGGVTSLIALLPQMNFLLSTAIKVAVALLLVLTAFGFQCKKQFIRNTFTLFILSFLINGALICFYLAIKPQGMAIINDTVYFNISPSMLIILTFIIYIILWLYKRLFKNFAGAYETVNVTISYKGKNYEIKCKVDSGCNVKEPFSGSYVIIVEENQMNGIKNNISSMRVIPFESLGGNGMIYGFKADQVKINEKTVTQEIYIGLCNNIFKNNYKGLIPESLVKD